MKKRQFFHPPPPPPTNCLYSPDFCGDRSGPGASEQSKHICLGRLLNYLATNHLVPPREYFFSLTGFWRVWSTGFQIPRVSLRYSWWCGGTCDLRHLDELSARTFSVCSTILRLFHIRWRGKYSQILALSQNQYFPWITPHAKLCMNWRERWVIGIFCTGCLLALL